MSTVSQNTRGAANRGSASAPQGSSSGTQAPPTGSASAQPGQQFSAVFGLPPPAPEVVVTTEVEQDDNSDDEPYQSEPDDEDPIPSDKGKGRESTPVAFKTRKPRTVNTRYINMDSHAKLGPPPVFENTSNSLEDVIFYCDMEYSMKPGAYEMDSAKTIFLVSHLNKAAFTWARTQITSKPQLADDYASFKESVRALYGSNDELSSLEAQSKLESLKQTKSASEYTALFEQYTSRLGFNVEAKEALYRRGLKPSLRRALAATNEIYDDYADLCRATIKLDSNLYAVDKAEKSTNKPSFSSSPSEPRSNKNKGKKPSGSRNSTARGPLSNAEREKRIKNNLCLYCGKPGHTVKDCKEKPKGNSANATLPFNALPSVCATKALKAKGGLLTQ